jgi:hypothetical protein
VLWRYSNCNIQRRWNSHRYIILRVRKQNNFLRYEVPMALDKNITVFWDVTPWNLAHRCLNFGEACCPNNQLSSTPKSEAASSSVKASTYVPNYTMLCPRRLQSSTQIPVRETIKELCVCVCLSVRYLIRPHLQGWKCPEDGNSRFFLTDYTASHPRRQ